MEKYPLLPVPDLLLRDASSDDDAGAKSRPDASDVSEAEKRRATSVIRAEMEHLTRTQERNNDEIKKRASDLQALRENNLVVAGAVSGLKKVLRDLLVSGTSPDASKLREK